MRARVGGGGGRYGGRVAEGFADLMAVMYGGGGDRVAPRAFKRLIGDLAPQFQGYSQHDSQELLNFLLDGLHEDLNRVKVPKEKRKKETMSKAC